MKTNLKYLIAVFALLCSASFANAQQNTLTQTTLSAAVPGQVQGQGTTTNVPAPTLVQVTSATGIVGINPSITVTAAQPNQSAIYVDRELMLVIAVNGTTLTVVRGINGTVATPHSSGAMVLAGKPIWFYGNDPGGTPNSGTGVAGATCVLNNVVATPWVNVRTGAQWACSPQTLTWAPWFNNPLVGDNTIDFGTAAAATGAQTILGPLFRLSGTNAITSFTIPVGFNATTVGGGNFCVYPTGAFTTTATNNIAAASTAVVGKLLCFTWNAATSKFAASY